MSTDDLVRCFGELDEELISEMLRIRQGGKKTGAERRRMNMKYVGTMAAVAAGVILVFTALFGSIRHLPTIPRTAAETTGENHTEQGNQESGSFFGVEEETEQEREAVRAVKEEESSRETVYSGSTETDREVQESENFTAGKEEQEVQKSDRSEDVGERTEYLVEASQGGLTIFDTSGRIAAKLDGACAVIWQENVLASEPLPILSWYEALLYRNSHLPLCVREGRYSQTLLSGEQGTIKRVYWEKDKPLPVVFPDEACTEDHISGQCGIYDIAAGDWIMDPQEHDCMTLLSDSVWTDTEYYETMQALPPYMEVSEIALVKGGSLMKTDGTVLDTNGSTKRLTDPHEHLEEANFLYRRAENWISCPEKGLYYNTAGRLLFACRPGTLVCDIGDGWYAAAENGGAPENPYHMVFYDFENNHLSEELSGLTYRGHAGGYLNWTDQAGNSLVTDRNLQILMTDAEFLDHSSLREMSRIAGADGNPVHWILQVVSADPGSEKITVRLADPEDENTALFLDCDRDFGNITTKKEQNDLTFYPWIEICESDTEPDSNESGREDPGRNREDPDGTRQGARGSENWSEAGFLVLADRLYYVDERGIMARSLTDGGETVLLAQKDGWKINRELAWENGWLYYVENSKTEGRISRILIDNGRVQLLYARTNINLPQLTYGPDFTPTGFSCTDMQMLAVCGTRLLFKSGSWFDYTAYYLDSPEKSPVSLMGNAGGLTGICGSGSDALFILEGFASDVSPVPICIYRADGQMIWERASYSAVPAPDGCLYYTDDTEYAESRKKWHDFGTTAGLQYPETETLMRLHPDTLEEEEVMTFPFRKAQPQQPGILLVMEPVVNPWTTTTVSVSLLADPDRGSVSVPYGSFLQAGSDYFLVAGEILRAVDFDAGMQKDIASLPGTYFMYCPVYDREHDTLYWMEGDAGELHMLPGLSEKVKAVQ